MSFSRSCIDISLHGTKLHAWAKDDNGNYHNSILDLDNIIGNDNGHLTWGERNFSETSRDIKLDGVHLQAVCQRNNGQWVHATLNLDDYIVNDDGSLKFSN